MKFLGSKQIKPQRYEFKTRYYDESVERLEDEFGYKFQESESDTSTVSNRMRRQLTRAKHNRPIRKSYFSSLFLVLILMVLTGGMYYIMEFM